VCAVCVDTHTNARVYVCVCGGVCMYMHVCARVRGYTRTRFFGGSLVALYVLFIVISVVVDVFGSDLGNSLVETSISTNR